MRLKTPIVKIGKAKIGGDNPILIQSMTNTDTSDYKKTSTQCIDLFLAGADMVRIAVDNEKSAEAVPKIRKILDQKGFKNFPLIGDFHFNGHKLLNDFPQCAKYLDKYRINPGNEKDFEAFINLAIKYDKPVRIGINGGSVKENDVNSIVDFALSSAIKAEKLGLKNDKIILSVKRSDIEGTIEAYELLVKKMMKTKKRYAIHLGLTEAGSGLKGIVSSTLALGELLKKGIGDTIRVSITPQNGKQRTEEVKVCKEILQALGLRFFKPQVTSCPGCGRTDNKFFQKLVKEITDEIENKIKIPSLKIAIMGCVVNGIGEAKTADIALCLPGKSERKIAQVYVKGKLYKNITSGNFSKAFMKILEEYIKAQPKN